MKVPFIDLKAQYESIKEEVDYAIKQVITASAFSGGPFVKSFEQEFAAYCDSTQCIAVGSGTEALWLILLALGVGVSDEVITVPNTFIATVEAIRLCGAVPIFVDVDPNTYTLNPDNLERVISRKTKAVIPVHLFGQTADMDPISAICKKHGLYLIEDACQAHGAEYKSRHTGSLGDAAAFSFYPGKNLGAYGEAGAVVTNNEQLAEKIRMIRDHGQTKKYHHDMNGWNARMDGLQAAVLSVKLRHLERWNEKRKMIADQYSRFLDNKKVIIPRTADTSKHVYHIYAIRVLQRDLILQKLSNLGVSCGIHYPIPIHLQRACSDLCLLKGSFPVAEKCSEEFLSLPMFAELDADSVKYVAEVINANVDSLMHS